MTPEEKEKIDYYISAKRKASDENIDDWAKTIFLVLLFFIVVYAILSNL